jgi:hypothetical protein
MVNASRNGLEKDIKEKRKIERERERERDKGC